MRFVILSIFFLLLSSSCKTTEPLCNLAKSAADGAAVSVGNILQCENVDAIKEDLAKVVDNTRICKQPEAIAGTLVAGIVCPNVAVFVSGLAVSSIPEDWKCEGGIATGGVKEAIEAGCRMALGAL